MIGPAPISPERITELHAAGGEMGPIADATQKPGCVAASIGAALSGAGYLQNDQQQNSEQLDPLWVAAFLLRSLALNHCFVDGNKRVAWLAALDVLAVGASLTLSADEEEAASFVLNIANGETRDMNDIIPWLAERLIAYE